MVVRSPKSNPKNCSDKIKDRRDGLVGTIPFRAIIDAEDIYA